MLGAIIGIAAVLVLLAVGFYFTRGGGTVPGGIDDPAVPGNGGLIWPHCGGLNWPHVRPTRC
jgi:hypothetical protein